MDHPADARRDERIAISQTTQVTLLGDPDRTVPAKVLDVSPYGACLELAFSPAADTPVRLHWDNHFLVGFVRHVQPLGDAFRVGVRLMGCSEWKGIRAGKLPLAIQARAVLQRLKR